MVTFGIFGNGIKHNNAFLTQFLEAYTGQAVTVQRIYPVVRHLAQSVTMLGWGRKKSYHRAARFAARHHLPLLTLEDGFLRSLDSGQQSRYGCSIVIDPIGIYFDAHQPSHLENLIRDSHLTPAEADYSQYLIKRIITERLSKYNPNKTSLWLNQTEFTDTQQHILLIDQVAGDQSIHGAGATKKTFKQMLKTAQSQHPSAQLWIKAHPAGKLGYLTELDLPDNIHIIRESVNPIELLSKMDMVYTVSSHMGFEALMLGKPVVCFGVPWYAGWGLTNDRYAPKKLYKQAFARRGQQKQASLLELFHACYLRYSYYVNPATGLSADIEAVIDWLATNREWRERLPHELTSYKISLWKRTFIQNFLQTADIQFFYKPRIEPRTLLSKGHIIYPKHYSFLVWGLARKQELQRKLAKRTLGASIWCMEDGFIRSNGLGAALIAPLSVVMDQRGIYYDATKPSDLEVYLKTMPALDDQQLARVDKLIKRLLDQQVSKYNVGHYQALLLPSTTAHQQKILVVGQVEDDMSVQCCASRINTNLSLLQKVRHDYPNAYIIYKPHPDVQAGLRRGKIRQADMNRYADQVVTDIAMPVCLAAVEAVHTISSLTGFEALLRGLTVVCYGIPFYAGWGLTDDQACHTQADIIYQRRSRIESLTLAQLVYGTLIHYPLYHLPDGYGLAQVEDVIGALYPAQEPSHTQVINSKAVDTKQLQQTVNSLSAQAKLNFMKSRQSLLKWLPRANDRT